MNITDSGVRGKPDMWENPLDAILAMVIKLPTIYNTQKIITIKQALIIWYKKETNFLYISNFDNKKLKKTLEECGVKPSYMDDKKVVYIALSHIVLRKRLLSIGIFNNYYLLLSNMTIFIRKSGPTRFAGLQKRYITMNMTNII